jgi:hypothetical protein
MRKWGESESYQGVFTQRSFSECSVAAGLAWSIIKLNSFMNGTVEHARTRRPAAASETVTPWGRRSEMLR